MTILAHATDLPEVDVVGIAWGSLVPTCPGAAAHVTTLTLKGQAEIVFFPEVHSCVNWPWSLP